MGVTTTSTLPAPVQENFNERILSTPVPNYIYHVAAVKFRNPGESGLTARFRRYNPIAPATVPLGNSGITPPSQNFTAVDIDATVDFYGTWLEINEQVTLGNEDPVLNNAAIRLGDSLRHTEDSLTRDMLASTASQINCVNGGNGDQPTNITEADIKIATTSLVNQNGYMFLSGIQGEDRFGTAPVRQAYFGLMHTEMIPDLEAVPIFKPSANYPNQDKVLDSEWGTVQNARFLVSSVAAKVANASNLGRDVYKTIYVAKEGYGILTQDKYTARFIYRPAIYSGPLAQNITVGWKTGMVPRLLNDAWVVCQNATIS